MIYIYIVIVISIYDTVHQLQLRHPEAATADALAKVKAAQQQKEARGVAATLAP